MSDIHKFEERMRAAEEQMGRIREAQGALKSIAETLAARPPGLAIEAAQAATNFTTEVARAWAHYGAEPGKAKATAKVLGDAWATFYAAALGEPAAKPRPAMMRPHEKLRALIGKKVEDGLVHDDGRVSLAFSNDMLVRTDTIITMEEAGRLKGTTDER
jgi:hypothetical protein